MEKVCINNLLNTYPRTRPQITEAHRNIFVEEYILNRSGKGLLYGATKLLESWAHRKLAKLKDPKSILEIGAGSLNHVHYETVAKVYDCIEPFSELFDNSIYLQKVRNMYNDIADIPQGSQYQRIISIFALEHLVDLPVVVARSGLLLSSEGVFQASIPSEGGFLWGLSWRMSTGLAFRFRTGLNYKTIIRHEHVNTAPEIVEVTKYFFDNVKISRFPFPLFHLSTFTYLEASFPRQSRCYEFLQSRELSKSAC